MTTLTTETFYDHAKMPWAGEIRFPSTRTFSQYSHRIYNRYPARSINLVPRAIIKSLEPVRKGSLCVLDPFMGSGTTAVEATLAQCEPFGVEIDPFARLISDVRVRYYGNAVFEKLLSQYSAICKKWPTYKPDIRLTPKLNNVSHWFNEIQFIDLLKLKNAIYEITCGDSLCRDFFRVVLADVIRPCSLAERQTLKPYISTKYIKNPADVISTFNKSFLIHLDAARAFDQAAGPVRPEKITWLGSDATSYVAEACSIDVAITSPPYLNALDYVRCIKIESAWVDCGNDSSFQTIRKTQVGDPSRGRSEAVTHVEEILGDICGEIALTDKDRSRTILGYFSDMFQNLVCTFKVLKPFTSYHLIVGDSVIRGISVPTHEIIAKLGQEIGFEWTNYYRYPIRDHRTSIPRHNNGGKIMSEHVVSLRKPRS